MEKNLPYGIMTSLKEICLRRVTVILWDLTDALDPDDRYPDEIEEIMDNIRKLELPSLLMEQMKHFVQPIGWEIMEFKMFHEQCLEIRFHKYIARQICWTYFGTIDYRKTAENMIHHEMFDVVKLYQLACIYCLEDYIPELWGKLPSKHKRYFSKYGACSYLMSPLPFCWPYILKGQETSVNFMALCTFGEHASFNQWAFEYSALTGNKAATEYFSQKFTDDERNTSIISTTKAVITQRLERLPRLCYFPDGKISENICFLLSLMSPEQQMDIFKWKPCNVLECLLDWHWQDLFLEITDRIWTSFSAADYTYLLRNICEKMEPCKLLSKLFQRFFLRVPSDFRKDFINFEYLHGLLLEACFKIEDSETLRLVFRNVDYDDRKRIVSSQNTMKSFYKAFFNSKWYLVELCLQEAGLSTEDRKKLKDAFIRFLLPRQSDGSILEKFCQSIDEANPNT